MHKHILARSVGLALLATGLLAGCGDKGGAPQGQGGMPPAAVNVVTLQSGPLAGLNVRVRNAVARSNYRTDIDENRLIRAELIKPFGAPAYLRTRNFATLLMGSDDKLWANWHCENGLAASYPLA